MHPTQFDSSRRKRLDEQIWLAHFNRVLRDEGVISQADYRKMALKIEARRKEMKR